MRKNHDIAGRQLDSRSVDQLHACSTVNLKNSAPLSLTPLRISENASTGPPDFLQTLPAPPQSNPLPPVVGAKHRDARAWMYQQGHRTIAQVDGETSSETEALNRENTMTNFPASITNPNQALWEKGDFTRIAAFMRQSGEVNVESLGITP